MTNAEGMHPDSEMVHELACIFYAAVARWDFEALELGVMTPNTVTPRERERERERQAVLRSRMELGTVTPRERERERQRQAVLHSRMTADALMATCEDENSFASGRATFYRRLLTVD